MNAGPHEEEQQKSNRGRRLVKWVRDHPRGTAVVTAIVAAFILGYLVGGSEETARSPEALAHDEAEEQEPLFWTCSMHPQINQPESGQCPICGMDLIPVYQDQSESEVGERELSLSPSAQMLAEIQTARAERKFVEAEVRMVGLVEYDETRVTHITAWVGGRLDRLYVDYTGIRVRKGDHMVLLYSPELLAAQEELLQALKAVGELEKSSIESMRWTAAATVDAVREKLRLWGLTEDQIQEIEQRGSITDHITINAPTGGVVVKKQAVEGMYVKTGSTIYTIADLSQVWVKLNAYESDLPWIRYGQTVEFETEAYPGETFTGKIAFIDPVLDTRTRTVKLRVNVPNEDGRLKPGMFVRARVKARITEGGKVADPDLAGKWISPMHPEVVKNSPGTCDVCGMPLVRAEEFGYASPEAAEPPLVIPATAPLVTGERAVVYVAIPGKRGAYEGREVTLGPRAGDSYIVKDGLNENELVVVNGNFKIDSALQILAKSSMMSPEGGVAAPQHHHGSTQPSIAPPRLEDLHAGHEDAAVQEKEVASKFREQLGGVLVQYVALQKALSDDQLDEAKQAGDGVTAALERVDMTLVEGPLHMAWMKNLESSQRAARSVAEALDLTQARESFSELSAAIIEATTQLGAETSGSIFRFHCPMAFDGQGADWLSNEIDVRNPYYGSAMLRCGTLTDTLSTDSGYSEHDGAK
jgi:Cu(I)/Ag(I) efflux system membrane fusion protein